MYWHEFKQLDTVVPPIEEQTAIASYIGTESAKIDKGIALHHQQIDKLKEYKATLINSAVTGKIDPTVLSYSMASVVISSQVDV